MARTGIAVQVGYGQEVTVGTAVTPTRFLPVVTESMKQTRTRIESEGDIPGRTILTSDQWNGGPVSVGGDIQHELYQGGVGVLLYNLFGAKATTGSGPYTHEFTFGSTFGKAMTVQIGRPDVSGTLHKFVYAGCKLTEVEFAMDLDKTATMGLTVVGMTEATGTSPTSPSFGTDHTKPYKAINHGALSIGGSAQPVKACSIKVTRPYNADRRFAGQPTTSEPVDGVDRTMVTGSLTVEFDTLALHDKFVDGDEAAFVYTLTSGDNSLTFDGNVRFDDASPVKTGRGVLEYEVPVVFVSDGSTDSDALTATLINSDSTA